MDEPVFRSITSEAGEEGVTYACGCPCTPTAIPSINGPGSEHCCCGKVHFAGTGAEAALTSYLAERKAKQKREPDYLRGAGVVPLAGAITEVAWAFPIEP